MAGKLACHWRDVRRCVVQPVHSARSSKSWSKSAETAVCSLKMKANGTSFVVSWPRERSNLCLSIDANFATLLQRFFERVAAPLFSAFSSLYFGSWYVDHDKGQIPFYWSGVFVFEEAFSMIQHSIRSFSFVLEDGVSRSEEVIPRAIGATFYYVSCLFSFCFSVSFQLSDSCSISKEARKRKAAKNKSL